MEQIFLFMKTNYDYIIYYERVTKIKNTSSEMFSSLIKYLANKDVVVH